MQQGGKYIYHYLILKLAHKQNMNFAYILEIPICFCLPGAEAEWVLAIWNANTEVDISKICIYALAD